MGSNVSIVYVAIHVGGESDGLSRRVEQKSSFCKVIELYFKLSLKLLSSMKTQLGDTHR